jgi:carboxypeptidase family protein
MNDASLLVLIRFGRLRLLLLLLAVFGALALSNPGVTSSRPAAKNRTLSFPEDAKPLATARTSLPGSQGNMLIGQGVSPSASSGSTSLFTITGSGASLAFGDYVSSSAALNTSYRYFVEVTPGLSRLVVDLFDADIGLGGAAEATAGRDRDRGGFNSSATYTLFNPSGVARNTLFGTGDATVPVGADNAWLSLFDSTGDNVRDNFTAVAYNNNDGLLTWATNWLETNDDNNAAAGLILITGGQLRIRDDGGGVSTIQREANLSGNGFSTATLTFDFSTQNTAASDQMRVEVSNNGGASWTTLETFTGSFGASSRSYNITAFIAANTRVRFIQVGGYAGTDSFFVDNLQIKENTVDAGHWEVRVNMSSAVTAGDDINAIGIRAHDGTAGVGGTELNMYVDSINGIGVNPPASGTNSRSYAAYPFITSGCTCSENDFDMDSNSSAVGSITFTSRSGAFSQTFASAALSTDNTWKRNTISGWTTDRAAAEYGVWTGNITVNSYLVAGTPNGNYASIFLANFQAAANPPAANPTANAFRIYLPTDAGTAPTKPFVRQTIIHTGGPNPPIVGQTTQVAIIIDVINISSQPITFSAANLVTANIPGAGAVYGGLPQASQGSIVSQPAIGGTGNITWNPGTVVAGATATLSYRVNATPISSGQRIPVTATPASGNGTRAQYVDETGNNTQARAIYLFGPLCELAVTAGVPTAAPATISGVITTASGAPLGGVIVSLTGNKNDRTITDSNGAYRFTDVDTDGFYSVTPSLANFTFAPSQRSFSLLGDRTDAVFTALPGSQLANPLDDEGFFVRQQYLDFLGREPEHGGWLYWSDEIARCGFDVECLRARRVAVSAAFFISDEFERTGGFIHRLYRGGLGRQPSFAEFIAARGQLVEGPNRETNKVNFTREFVRQPEFLERYSQATNGQTFVDALIDGIRGTSGVELSAQRGALVDAYNQGTDLNESRSLALRSAIEDASFAQAEFNRAFVLMQYFGYLRRDPDQGGFGFWLDVLNNREQNNYLGMVCAFVTSTEYQQRFSTAVTHSNAECGR